MLNTKNYFDTMKGVNISQLPEALKKGHEFVLKSTENNDNWKAYENGDATRKAIDLIFLKMAEHIEKLAPKADDTTKSERKKGLKIDREETEKSTQVAPIKSKPSPPTTEGEDIEFVERIPDEIRFIRRCLSLHGKKKTKEDLLRFINAMHRSILEKRIRKASPYAKQMNYIQDKLVKRYNEMGNKAEAMVLSEKTITDFKDIISSQKVMPSVALIKRYIGLNGKFDVKERAANLLKAMNAALEKGKVKTKDPYRKVYDRMLENLNSYVKNKSQKILSIEETELNGLHGLLGHCGCEVTKEEKPPVSQSNSRTHVMSLDEAKSSQFQTIGLDGKWRLLIGNACMPTHALIYGEGGSGKTSCALKYAEYLNQLGHKILYVAGEQYNTPTFTELLTNLNISGNENFALVKGLDVMPVHDFEFVVLDSKDSLNLDVNDFRALKKAYPNQSFIITSQGTKTGDFTGSGQWRNEVDTMIFCEKGIAMTVNDKNRWGGKGEVKIYDNGSTPGLNGKPTSSNAKDKMLYDILSPDGFTIRMPDDKLFKSKEEGLAYFEKWKKRFETQGYYSSNRGRIPLVDLADDCSWEEVPKSKADSWFGFRQR